MQVKHEAARTGITFGSALAIAISWPVNKSVIWAMIHGLLSWVYVIYYTLATLGLTPRRIGFTVNSSMPGAFMRPIVLKQPRRQNQRSKMMKSILALAVLLAGVFPLQATLILGGPATGGNSFPFTSSAGTRYQQVYDAAAFGSALTITGITFYTSRYPGSTTSARTFTFHLSTTSADVDDLSTDMSANVGPDDMLFAVYNGGESIASSLTVYGTPFSYNPLAGNLLLDIFVGAGSGGSGYFDARNNDANGVFSRMHDFGSGYDNYGLVTGFETEPGGVIPEPSSLGFIGLGLALIVLKSRRR